MKKVLFLFFLLMIFPLNILAVEVLEENETITREVKGAYLKSLEVTDYDISPNFDKMNNDYTLLVLEDVEEINIEAIADNKNSRIQIIGNTKLEYGENIITIKVTLEDNIQEYRIFVTKEHLKTVANYVNEEEETIQTVHKDNYLIAIVASGCGFIILLLAIVLFRQKKK